MYRARNPPPGTLNHVSFAKNRVSFRKNDPEFDRVYDGDTIPKDHVYLGAFGPTISPQINLPSLFRNPPKITQRKDARIRVMSGVGFTHVFLDLAKGAPDLHFHVGELEWGRVSDKKRRLVSDGG